jgi:hypothetical protein
MERVKLPSRSKRSRSIKRKVDVRLAWKRRLDARRRAELLEEEAERHAFREDEERPLTRKERAELREAERNLDAAAHIMAAIRRVDAARSSMNAASDALYDLVSSRNVPKVVREDFERFWTAGGTTHRHYGAWLSGRFGRGEPVSQRKHLRLVVANKNPVRRLMRSDPPEAA